MPSKEQTHSSAKEGAKKPPQPAAGIDRLSQPQTLPAAVVPRARLDPKSLAPRDVLQLQRLVGNRAVVQLLAKDSPRQPRPVIQPKLMVGPTGDRYEQEADRVAEQVMGMPAPTSDQRPAVRSQSAVQRQDEEEELQAKPLAQRAGQDEVEEVQPQHLQRQEEEELQTKPDPMGSFEAGSAIEGRTAQMSPAVVQRKIIVGDEEYEDIEFVPASWKFSELEKKTYRQMLNSEHTHQFGTRDEMIAEVRNRSRQVAGPTTAVPTAGPAAADPAALFPTDVLSVAIRGAEASGNATVRAIAARLREMVWPDGKEPKIKLVAPEELTTTAFYEITEHTIKAKRGEPVDKLWDNILFEAQNAANQGKFRAALAMKGRTPPTLSAYGRAYAEVEYDSFKKYVTALRATGLPKDQMSEQAKSQLEKADEYARLSEAQAIEAFITSPHMRGAAGKAGLSSADLYAYEALEGYDKGAMLGKVFAVMGATFQTYGKWGPASTAVRKVFGDAAWPEVEPEQPRRPHFFHRLVEQAILAVNAIAEKDRTKSYDPMKDRLRTLKLSETAQRVALDAYTQSTAAEAARAAEIARRQERVLAALKAKAARGTS